MEKIALPIILELLWPGKGYAFNNVWNKLWHGKGCVTTISELLWHEKDSVANNFRTAHDSNIFKTNYDSDKLTSLKF